LFKSLTDPLVEMSSYSQMRICSEICWFNSLTSGSHTNFIRVIRLIKFIRVIRVIKFIRVIREIKFTRVIISVIKFIRVIRAI
jgi:hypothetical protein